MEKTTDDLRDEINEVDIRLARVEIQVGHLISSVEGDRKARSAATSAIFGRIEKIEARIYGMNGSGILSMIQSVEFDVGIIKAAEKERQQQQATIRQQKIVVWIAVFTTLVSSILSVLNLLK